MALSENEFKAALREAVSLDYSHITFDGMLIGYSFSKRFNKRMEKLIRAQKKSYYPLVNTISKRIAIAIIAFTVLLSASMSVKAIREPIVSFFIEIYGKFSRIVFTGDTNDAILKEYEITELPEGYKKVGITHNFSSRITSYQNTNDDIIKFKQSSTYQTMIDLDNEQTVTEIRQIGDTEYRFYSSITVSDIQWIQDGYYFEIIAYNTLSYDDLLQIAKSVE